MIDPKEKETLESLPSDISRSNLEVMSGMAELLYSFQEVLNSLGLVINSSTYKEEMVKRDLHILQTNVDNVKLNLLNLQNIQSALSHKVINEVSVNVDNLLTLVQELNKGVTEYAIKGGERNFEQFKMLSENFNESLKKLTEQANQSSGNADTQAEVLKNLQEKIDRIAYETAEKLQSFEDTIEKISKNVENHLKITYEDRYLDEEGKDLPIQKAFRKWIGRSANEIVSKNLVQILVFILVWWYVNSHSLGDDLLTNKLETLEQKIKTMEKR